MPCSLPLRWLLLIARVQLIVALNFLLVLTGSTSSCRVYHPLAIFRFFLTLLFGLHRSAGIQKARFVAPAPRRSFFFLWLEMIALSRCDMRNEVSLVHMQSAEIFKYYSSLNSFFVLNMGRMCTCLGRCKDSLDLHFIRDWGRSSLGECTARLAVTGWINLDSKGLVQYISKDLVPMCRCFTRRKSEDRANK
jgi:hypothetical protein